MNVLGNLVQVRQGLAVAGRAAGASAGDWYVNVIESADIVNDHVELEDLREIGIRQSVRSEAHLLRPYDLLVTARAHSVRIALVPPDVSRTVAAATILVVRAPDPSTGLAHFLWYYLTSTCGRAAIAARLSATSLPSLSARALSEVQVPLLPADQMRRLLELIEATEASRMEALEALRVRHDMLRDSIIAQITETANRKES